MLTSWRFTPEGDHPWAITSDEKDQLRLLVTWVRAQLDLNGEQEGREELEYACEVLTLALTRMDASR